MRHVFFLTVLLSWGSMLVGCGGDSSDGAVADNTALPAAGGMPGDAASGDGSPEGMPGGDAGMPGDETAAADAGPPGDEAGLPGYGGMPGDPGYVEDGTINYPDGFDPALVGMPGDGLPGAMPGDYDGRLNPDGTVPGVAAPVKPTTLDGLAQYTFQQGREKDGFLYLYAWGLTSDAGAAEVLSSYGWVSDLRRPAMAVRWGVGVQLTAPKNFAGDPKPIGTTQGLTVGKRREGGTDGGGGGYATADAGFDGGIADGGYAAPAAQDQLLTRYTGEFGQKILQEFQTRIADGKFGKAYQNTPSSSLSPGSNFADAGVGIDAAGGTLPGDAYPGGGVGGPAYGVGVPPRAGGTSLVTPGLVALGLGSEKELVEKAKKEGVDVLAVVRVKITVNRLKLVKNECSIALVDVAKYDPTKPAKPMFLTAPPLDNNEVEIARQGNKDDGVDKEVKELFEYIDAKLVIGPLPNIPADAVKSTRVAMLAQGKYDNPLPVLSEIRFYNRNKLLTDEDTAAAMTQLLGSDSDAKTLLEGSEEERKLLLEKWLPRS